MPNSTPRTIEELKAWYVAHNLPPEEVTRFFIGKDIREPKAFGIYQEGVEFVVYKNKADGSRAVRYRGQDEGYAVNELYQKLKQEIAGQKALSAEERAAQQRQNRISTAIVAVVVVIFVALTIFFISQELKKPSRGYYHYDDGLYYYQDDYWYYYYDDYGWYPAENQPELNEKWADYYEGATIADDGSIVNFEMTEYYSHTDSSSSWSSSDSWDSGSTDWSSDW